MPTFQKPNLKSSKSHVDEPFISVRNDRLTIGINNAAARQIGATEGKRLHYALDRSRHPWVGVIDDRTAQEEPKIRTDDQEHHHVNASLLATQLMRLVDGGDEVEGAVRFYLAGETAEDPDTGVTLHRLDVPDLR